MQNDQLSHLHARSTIEEYLPLMFKGMSEVCLSYRKLPSATGAHHHARIIKKITNFHIPRGNQKRQLCFTVLPARSKKKRLLIRLLDLSRPSLDVLALGPYLNRQLNALHSFGVLQKRVICHSSSIGTLRRQKFQHGEK